MELRKSTMVLIAVLLLCTVHGTFSRLLTPCQIARELYQRGIPPDQLNHWVCLVMSESSGDTNAINTQNADGSVDYGLFQINSYWCDQGSAKCGVPCSELRRDDIGAAFRCALYIHREGTGFEEWVGWKNKCRGRHLEDYTRCLQKPSCSCPRAYAFS
jgi:hypothetical protein